MKTTVAGVRGDQLFHCSLGHVFSVPYEDKYGEWCPDCGNGAHSYDKEKCAICGPVWVDASNCFRSVDPLEGDPCHDATEQDCIKCEEHESCPVAPWPVE